MLKVTAKQTLASKFMFKAILLLGRLRLINLKTALKMSNKLIEKGSFRYRIGKGEWKKLNNFEITLEEGV